MLLISKINQNGMSFEYIYNNRGNSVSEKRSNEEPATYEYDVIRQLIRVKDRQNTTSGING